MYFHKKEEQTNNMEKKIKVYYGILYLCFLIIIGRLFVLQIIERNIYLEKLSNRQNKIVYEDTSLRGRIYDRNNVLIVDNKLIPTIYYQKEEGMKQSDEIKLAYEISKKIELDYQKLTNSYLKDFYLLEHNNEIEKRVNKEDKDRLQKRLMNNNEYYQIKKGLVTNDDLEIYNDEDKKAIYLYYLMNNGYSYQEKVIKEGCTEEEMLFFAESNHLLHGFDMKYIYGRDYLYKDTLKTIIGRVGNIPFEMKDYYLSRDYAINDKVGLSNLELVYDDYLKGEKAMYLIKNHEKTLIKPAKRGNDLKLTIDIKLQSFVDKILEDEVRKAKNSYNANYYHHSYVMITNTLGEVLSMNGKEIINNKVVDVAYGNILDNITAGSVVKAASMLVGFNTGAIKIGEVMKDECIKIRSTPKKCSIYNMGNINDINALAFSSNVYQFKTAIKVGKGVYRYDEPLKINDEAFDIYRDYFGRFGLGVNTGIDLPNESKGYKGSSRSPGLLLNFAIGQYDTYTNIQLNQYISTIAQDGKRYKMHLLKEINDGKNNILKVENEVMNEINVESKYLNRVKEGLKAVTSYGSGRAYVNISASGKTGTSESFIDTDNDGKIDTETISTNFVLFAPSVNPKVAISIVSPHIGLPYNEYRYPINQNVIKTITNNLDYFFL